MMDEFTYVIEGNEINDKDSFYDQIFINMTEDPDTEPGRNLNALADILRGGFGMHEYGEQIAILWTGFEHSRKALGDEFTNRVLKVMLKNDDEYDVILKIE